MNATTRLLRTIDIWPGTVVLAQARRLDPWKAEP